MLTMPTLSKKLSLEYANKNKIHDTAKELLQNSYVMATNKKKTNNEKSIEERIEEIKKTDAAEIVGEIMGLESIIIILNKKIEILEIEKKYFQYIRDPLFADGIDAFENGYEYEECPHDFDTDSECGWKKGWKIAEKYRKIIDSKTQMEKL